MLLGGHRTTRAGWSALLIPTAATIALGSTRTVASLDSLQLCGLLIGVYLITCLLCFTVLSRTRSVTIEFQGNSLRASWRGPVCFARSHLRLGPWVEHENGVFLEVDDVHGGRPLRIGARDLPLADFVVDAPAQASLDIEIAATDLSSILGQLPLRRRTEVGQTVELLSYSDGGGPRHWFLFMLVVSVFGWGAAVTGWLDRFVSTRPGGILMAAMLMVLSLYALLRAFGEPSAERPVAALRLRERGLVLEEPIGRLLASAEWHAVRAQALVHRSNLRGHVRETSVLLMSFGGQRELRAAAYGPGWPEEERRNLKVTWSCPTLSLTAADWKQLVSALRSRGCLEGRAKRSDGR
jgi:hypothetical protein